MNAQEHYHYGTEEISPLCLDYYLIELPDAVTESRTIYSLLLVEHWDRVAVETAFFYDVTDNRRALSAFLQKVAAQGVDAQQMRYVIEDALQQVPSPLQ